MFEEGCRKDIKLFHINAPFLQALSKVCDHSAIEAIHSMSEKYRRNGKRLHLHDLAPDCSKLLSKAGDLVEGQYFGKVSGGGH